MPERNQIIDDLRGICMLGVIGIHVGSFVLEAPYPNSFLYMLLEILSRYSVPAFFYLRLWFILPIPTRNYYSLSAFLKNGCKVSDFPMLSGHCFICFTFLLLCQDV